MKYNRYFYFALPLLFLTGCFEKKERPVAEDPYEIVINDVQGTVKDTVLTGYLGEETGMSSLQLITDFGDTLSISKTKSDGTNGIMLGEVRNYEDRVMILANQDEDQNLFLISFLNITQLEGVWKNGTQSISLRPDSSVVGTAMNYTHWQVDRCKILFSGNLTTEYGITSRIDTVSINFLDEDSLHLTTHRYGQLKLGR